MAEKYSISFKVIHIVNGEEHINTVKKTFPLIKGKKDINHINIAISEIRNNYTSLVKIQLKSSSL